MKKVIAALALLFAMVVPVCSGQTFNTWERGYITTAVHGLVPAVDSLDVTPPIIGSDTLNVRGFMIGYKASTHGHDHVLQIRYREAGDDGWYRWNQWIEHGQLALNSENLGLPLPSKWQGIGGGNSIGITPFMPISNVRLLRIFNYKVEAPMTVIVLWFMDEQYAKGADWSAWSM